VVFIGIALRRKEEQALEYAQHRGIARAVEKLAEQIEQVKTEDREKASPSADLDAVARAAALRALRAEGLPAPPLTPTTASPTDKTAAPTASAPAAKDAPPAAPTRARARRAAS
jgi:hypothetical protein